MNEQCEQLDYHKQDDLVVTCFEDDRDQVCLSCANLGVYEDDDDDDYNNGEADDDFNSSCCCNCYC